MNPVPAIDYTSRDFQSIRQDLLNTASVLFPEWTNRDDHDFGVILLELFAATADGLHYYADRVANESFLDTATQPDSLLRLARLLGYTPTGRSAAKVTLTFTNTSASPILVPALTQVLTDGTDTVVTFETDTDVTVPANGTATVTATEGTSVLDEALGNGSGTADQVYALASLSVIDGSEKITVNDGVSILWRQVASLYDSDSLASVYARQVDATGRVLIMFGDGANGRAPAVGASITASYRVGGGTVGNVPVGTLTRFAVSPTVGLSVTNAVPAGGGTDPDTVEQIRQGARAASSTVRRAVTLTDFAQLALDVPAVRKASADTANLNSVTVYISVSPETDVLAAPSNQAFLDAKAAVLAYLNARKPATTTVTVANPVYVPINITATLTINDAFRQDQTVQDAKIALAALLDYDNVFFKDTINLSDVYGALSEVPGLFFPQVTVLSRTTSGLSGIALATNQIPKLRTVTLTPVGGIA